MYVHIQMHPSTFSLGKLKSLLAQNWTGGALRVWAFTATYHEKDKNELRWCRRALRLVDASCPAEYRQGVHLLQAEGGFMGEDVFVVDGQIRDTLHLKHNACNTYKLLRRNRAETRCLWCAKCNRFVAESEIDRSR